MDQQAEPPQDPLPPAVGVPRPDLPWLLYLCALSPIAACAGLYLWTYGNWWAAISGGLLALCVFIPIAGVDQYRAEHRLADDADSKMAAYKLAGDMRIQSLIDKRREDSAAILRLVNENDRLNRRISSQTTLLLDAHTKLDIEREELDALKRKMERPRLPNGRFRAKDA